MKQKSSKSGCGRRGVKLDIYETKNKAQKQLCWLGEAPDLSEGGVAEGADDGGENALDGGRSAVGKVDVLGCGGGGVKLENLWNNNKKKAQINEGW